jgi:hypothetical protein
VALGFTGSAPSGSSSSSSSSGSSSGGSSSTNSGSTSSGNGAGNGAGAQFITGPCNSDADCASACCGFNSGKCAGPVIAQERDGGCGFGDGQPNDTAAQAFRNAQRRCKCSPLLQPLRGDGSGEPFLRSGGSDSSGYSLSVRRELVLLLLLTGALRFEPNSVLMRF